MSEELSVFLIQVGLLTLFGILLLITVLGAIGLAANLRMRRRTRLSFDRLYQKRVQDWHIVITGRSLAGWRIRAGMALIRLGSSVACLGRPCIGDPTEALAEYAHAAWAGWMRYLFSKGVNGTDGSWVMPPGLVRRWKRQMATPYYGLIDSEKQSDREEAAKIMKVLEAKGAGDG